MAKPAPIIGNTVYGIWIMIDLFTGIDFVARGLMRLILLDRG